MVLLHKPRVSGWQSVSMYDKLRLTKGKGKRLKLQLFIEQYPQFHVLLDALRQSLFLVDVGTGGTRSQNSNNNTTYSLVNDAFEVQVRAH